MKTFTALAAAAAGLAGLASGSAVAKRDASTPIIVQGNAFFQGNNRFYIRGVDYQPGGSSGSPGSTGANDPLEDDASDACLRDIKNFQDLGLNTIRVYTVDNSKGHDTCMNALKAAGIYLILDVNTPNSAINRDAPQESYNPTYLQNIFATMDAFAKYDNTLAFLSGNEVINDTQASTGTAPYIKAVTRDMKNYIKSQNYRSIPVGYSGADVQSTRYETAEFLNCGPDSVRSDFFAFNDYSWCDPSSFTTSGWDKKVQLFSNYSLPIFLSEFGCITNGRDFQEVATLYGTQMTGVYSGGLVYEYSNEASGYGLGDIDGSTYNPLKDYDALKTANQKTPLPTGDGGYRKDAGGASQCPPASSTWSWGNDTLPDLPSGAKQYFNGKGAGTGKGLGLFSMQAGGYSTSFSLPSGESSDHPSGTSTSGSSTSSKSAGPMNIPQFSFVPLVIAGTWAVSAIFGGSALFL